MIPELTLSASATAARRARSSRWAVRRVFVRAETGRYGESIDCLEGMSTSTTSASRSRTSAALRRRPHPDAGRRRPAARHDDGGRRLGRPLRDRARSAAPFAVVPAVAVAPAHPGRGAGARAGPGRRRRRPS